MKTFVIIPAYNEERTVGEVVRSVRAYIPDVVVVDDGSQDATGERARHAGAMVVTHCVNRGLGAAIGTGIAAALRHGADAIVTLDADGQHDPAEIAALAAPVAAELADLVIGVRWTLIPSRGERERNGFPPFARSGGGARGGGAPFVRRIFNSIANLITRTLFGVRCSDTQSGFRCFSRHAASRIEIRTNRMEVSSEILAEAVRHELRIAEVPIRTIYTEYSMSKGQSLTTGIRTAWALLLRRWF